MACHARYEDGSVLGRENVDKVTQLWIKRKFCDIKLVETGFGWRYLRGFMVIIFGANFVRALIQTV